MSESQETPLARGARYQRSPNGLVGAMVVTVLLVLAFVGFRAITRDNTAVPVKSVDYRISLKAGRDAHQLQTLAPPTLPSGWKATSASYTPGAEPAWHLGLLTAAGKYVGIEESRDSEQKLAQTYVDPNAEQGRPVRVGGQSWQVWTDAGGDYALTRSLKANGTTVESWLVGGSAPDAQVRDLAASLEGGTVRAAG